MKKGWITVLVIGISVTAIAGKEERDYMTKEVMPTVKDAEAKWKSSCGCTLAIKVDESTVKMLNDMHGARYIASEVADGVGAYCTDEASKKAMCQMKSLTIGKADKAEFHFKGGNGVATTDGQSNCSFEMMTREIDK